MSRYGAERTHAQFLAENAALGLRTLRDTVRHKTSLERVAEHTDFITSQVLPVVVEFLETTGRKLYLVKQRRLPTGIMLSAEGLELCVTTDYLAGQASVRYEPFTPETVMRLLKGDGPDRKMVGSFVAMSQEGILTKVEREMSNQVFLPPESPQPTPADYPIV